MTCMRYKWWLALSKDIRKLVGFSGLATGKARRMLVRECEDCKIGEGTILGERCRYPLFFFWTVVTHVSCWDMMTVLSALW